MSTNDYTSLKNCAQRITSRLEIKNQSNAKTVINTVKKSKAIIDSAFCEAVSTIKKGHSLPEVLQWVYDNYYLYDETVQRLIKDLKPLKDLPCADAKDSTLMPLYFIVFYRYMAETECDICELSVSAFISGITQTLSYNDFYSFGALFMSGIIARIAALFSDKEYRHSADGIGKMTAAIRFMSDYSFESFIEKSSAERILRLDPSGDYCNMTDGTKDFYRSRLVKLARENGFTEEEYAKEILGKASQDDKGKEKHIGFYLYPQKRRLYGLLYFAFLLSSSVITMLFLIKIHPVFLIALFPVYELSKQISDKLLSYFIPSFPLPALNIKALPDTDGVLTVITTVLNEKSINELFVRLEDMYHSCGTKNAYFAILADFPESENPRDASDDQLYSYANDRIASLNMKYGSCFFLFVRKRTYNPGERKFMGYERKRGAIDELCKYLSQKSTSGFIPCRNMPGKDVCSKIRYILTLDSDTSIPHDAVRKLAGIMLHPLNRPVIDESMGVVTDGYALLQSAVSTELSSASKTAFSRIFSGSGGFEIYSFSGFELYQSVFGEGTFCGKGMFDKDAYMKCIGNYNVAFPENTVLSHDILEGARLKSANVTELRVTDGFPGNTVSYLKRHHRWVRGDTQNLLFLRKYIPTKNGKTIKNNISALSKYKLFDNFRRSAVPVFAYSGVLASCLLQKNESALLLLFSLFYILYGFISDFASKLSSVGIGCTARKYFSKNAIPGILLSFYRVLIEVSMLPSLAFCSLSAICISLYRMLVSRRNMLEWTTASMGEASVKDSLSYYIGKNMLCALSGTVVYVFSAYSFLKLIGLMWFIFPVTAYFLGKVRKEQSIVPTTAEKKTVTEYARDMWHFFEDAVTPGSNFLPIDNIQLYPDERHSSKTSPTNIGLYLISVLAARDFGFIDSNDMYSRLKHTFDTLDGLKKWNGHLYNWYSTENCTVIEPSVISSVDSGNFLACLISLKEGLKEYVNEKTELLDIISKAENIVYGTRLEKLYDNSKKLFYIEARIDNSDTAHFSQNHFDMLMSEARTLSYIAIAKKKADICHYGLLSRPLIKHSDRIGVASWTGTAFEYFMPTLFMPVVKGSLPYEALRFAMYRQKARYATTSSGKVFGISESGYYAFDKSMNYQYRAFGIPELGFKSGLENDLVISPYSSFLMMCLDIKAPLANLKLLKKEKLYGKYGFYEAYDFTEARCLTQQPVFSVMSHHTGMSIIACANALFGNIFVKRFMQDASMRSIHELLEERIPVDCAVKRLKFQRNIPDRAGRTNDT